MKMKRLISLALALALCLGLTIPVHAAGDFTIENGVLTKYNGSGGKVVIPDSVTAIGDSAFNICDTITSVTIPNSVSSIGRNAFFNCTNLTDVEIPASLTDIGPWAFVGTPWLERLGEFPVVNGCLLIGPSGKASVVIPDGVKTICGQAFYAYSIMNFGDNALKSVKIPDSVTKIGDSAFRHCDALTDINIPDGVTDIEEDAFWDCGSLASFTIPSGISSIKPGTFAWCSGLTNITIPSNITEIGDSAFYQSGLTSITIPSSVKTIGKEAFKYCEKLASVSIPGSVETIGKEAFSHCTSLTNVTIPDGVTEIEAAAFSGCENLTDVTIPSSITEIKDGVFRDCSNLTNVTIPASVTKIGRVFYYLIGGAPLPKVTIHGVAGSYAETYAKTNNIPFVADGSAAPSTPIAPASPTKFTDVSPTSPFVDAINWAVEKSITGGKTATTFAPGEECTRGQILTFLWRANGSPEPTINNPFTDSIPASFQKAAVWAYEKGLVSGAAFGSATPCTRAVAVEYLWKATGSPTASESASFADVPANANYAQAVAWAVESGVTGGTGNGQFSPDNTCTRGQIVTFLYRAMGK